MNENPIKLEGTMQHKQAKPVYQICRMTMKTIKEYPSIAAAARELGIYYTEISRVLRGKAQSARGYFWQYAKK